MAIDHILSAIDAEIATLQEAKQLLSTTPGVLTTAGKRGRPKGSKNTPSPGKPASKRTMSAEGRAKIAEAQRKRHAAKKKAVKKTSAGETA